MADMDVRRCWIKTGLYLEGSALFIRPVELLHEICLADDLDRAAPYYIKLFFG